MTVRRRLQRKRFSRAGGGAKWRVVRQKGGVEEPAGFFNRYGSPAPGASVEKPRRFFNKDAPWERDRTSISRPAVSARFCLGYPDECITAVCHPTGIERIARDQRPSQELTNAFYSAPTIVASSVCAALSAGSLGARACRGRRATDPAHEILRQSGEGPGTNQP